MNKNIAFSLSYNLVSETEKCLERIYSQNERGDFTHTVIDLGFPLLEGDKIPDDIGDAKQRNTEALKELAHKHGSGYLKLPNVGVQQNHSAFYHHAKPDDSDALISCDVDEVTLTNNWIRSMARAVKNSNIALVSLMQIDIEPLIKPDWYEEIWVEGERCWIMKGLLNWCQIAFKGEFLNKIGLMLPYPEEAKVYGYIEMLAKQFFPLGYNWALLPDVKCQHTNVGSLYRGWKDYIILDHPGQPQLSFDDYLQMKKEGLL